MESRLGFTEYGEQTIAVTVTTCVMCGVVCLKATLIAKSVKCIYYIRRQGGSEFKPFFCFRVITMFDVVRSSSEETYSVFIFHSKNANFS